jgi:hypothetical protein
MHKAIFEGLVVDESDHVVEAIYVGGEPCYIVKDGDFKRHIPSEQVDRQVFTHLRTSMEGKEDLISEQTAKMMGQEDVFTKAVLLNQLKNMDKQIDQLMETGIPADARAYLGMMGFKVVINMHGEVVRIEQPNQAEGEGGEGDG